MSAIELGAGCPYPRLPESAESALIDRPLARRGRWSQPALPSAPPTEASPCRLGERARTLPAGGD